MLESVAEYLSLKNPLRGVTVTKNWQSAMAPGR
jgi:hypothetical protein